MAKASERKKTGRKIRFGGDGLPEGAQTWFIASEAADRPGAQVFVKTGDEYPEDHVTNAKSYIDRGLASVV